MIFRLIYFAVRLMSYIPLSMGQALGKILGIAALTIPMERKSVALNNIERRINSLDCKNKSQALLKRVYVHFGQMFFEIPHIMNLTDRNLDKYVEFANESNFIRALEKGKGVLILTAHFGNWELLIAALSIRYGNFAMVARQNHYLPAAQIIHELRSRPGTEIIKKKGAIKNVKAAICEKKVVAVALDQNVDSYLGVFVMFLGEWACTNIGLALMALETGAPIVPAFALRSKDGRHRIVFENEIPLIKTDERTTDIEESTACFSRTIEEYVRKYPDHWFWFHKRWKTQHPD